MGMSVTYHHDGLHVGIELERVEQRSGEPVYYHFSGMTTYFDAMCGQLKYGRKVIHPRRIWQNDGRHTTVEWMDGTKTTVCCEDPEKYTEWGGFCACVTKKLYGSATKAEAMLDGAKETTAWPAKKKRIEREKLKELKRNKAEARKKAHEIRVQEEMERIRIQLEAQRRVFDDDVLPATKKDITDDQKGEQA